MVTKAHEMSKFLEVSGNKTSLDDLSFMAQRMIWAVGSSLHVI